MAKARVGKKAPAKKGPAKKAPAKKAPTAPTTAVPLNASLDELYADWDAFMPRDRKATRLTFTLDTPRGPLTPTLRFQFYCYIDSSSWGYVGDTLREAIKSFIHGGEGFPSHPDGVFTPGSVKIEGVPPGYARPMVKEKLSAILAAEFRAR